MESFGFKSTMKRFEEINYRLSYNRFFSSTTPFVLKNKPVFLLMFSELMLRHYVNKKSCYYLK